MLSLSLPCFVSPAPTPKAELGKSSLRLWGCSPWCRDRHPLDPLGVQYPEKSSPVPLAQLSPALGDEPLYWGGESCSHELWQC